MAPPSYTAQSLTELLAIRVSDAPEKEAIFTGVEADANDPANFLRSLTYSQLNRAVDRLCYHYATLSPPLRPSVDPSTSLPPVRIIAVLTPTAIDISLLEIALARLGLTPLLLSTNNSVAAVAHLIKITNSTHLIYGSKYTQEAKDAQKILADQGYNSEFALVEDKRFPLWGPGGVDDDRDIKPFPAALTPDQERTRPAVILHSSGSTGFPKPVYITHYGLVANIALNQNKPGFSSLPLFHGYGHFALFRCIYSKQPFTLFPPYMPLTAGNMVRVIDASPWVRQCFAVPYVIKLMSETRAGIAALANFDIVGYAGAALPDDLGDRLTAAGVKLLSIYGTTETGSLMNSHRDYEHDKLWNWVRRFPTSEDYVKMEFRGDGDNDTYEVVVAAGYPPMILSNRPDGSYATSDLFRQHPSQKGFFKYVGRLDDTLVQTLGEKTNPVPIELSIRGNSPLVAEAIVFGASRPQVGVLILPSDQAHEEGLDGDALIDRIWDVIEGANGEAPRHSRIGREMVGVLPYGTNVPVATKMSILRPACYAKFKDIIDAMYERLEEESSEPKVTLIRKDLEVFILDTILAAIGSPAGKHQLTKDVDLFAFGVDSLQGTKVRNVLQQRIELDGKVLGQNVVYEYPSVAKLATHILDLQQGGDGDQTSEQQQVQVAMLSMLDKFASQLSTKPTTNGHAATKRKDGHVVVLTGASGSLGAHILAQLVASPAVRKVICLSRASSHADSLDRVNQSLQLRKLVLSKEQTGKIQSFAANANADLLELSKEEYESIREEVTVIIHNAWPVNFVLSIESYDEHVRGALNLINLAVQSPATADFYFSSSISCRQGGSEIECTEDYSTTPATAAKTGYARSKWVVEKLCQQAAAKTPVNVGVFRIGQMVGDSINGVWNETEAWPLMFKGANTVGYLPTVNEHPSWLPVDYAGRAIAEIILQPSQPKSTVYHIVNPNISASWTDILDGLKAAGLKFDAVDRVEWLQRLADSDKDPKKNPIIKLLSFFRNRYSNPDKQPMIFLTEKTGKVAPSILASPPVSKELVGKWVAHWRKEGFIV